MTKRLTGFVSPFLLYGNGDLLHIQNPGLYDLIKREYWGYVIALKYYAKQLYEKDKSELPKLFSLEVRNTDIGFEILLKRSKPWPFHPNVNSHPNSFSEVIAVSFDGLEIAKPLFRLKYSNTIFAKTFCVDIQREMSRQMLKCAARMMTNTKRKALTRKYAMEQVLIDLNLLSD